MKTAVLTFVYPLAEAYYRETLSSVFAQTDNNFDTIVVDDDLGVEILRGDVRVLRNSNGLGLIPLREAVFNQLLDEGYDLIISVDADDTMSSDRVRETKAVFEREPKAAFYYSPLYYLSNPEEVFFDLPERVDDLQQILYYNFIGLSHTSLNLRYMREQGLRFSFPASVIALDWYLASWYLVNGGKGVRAGGRTYYRIYDNNLAGRTAEASAKKVQRILDVKKAHYEALEKILSDSSVREAVRGERKRLNKLANGIVKLQTGSLSHNRAADSGYWWAGY